MHDHDNNDLDHLFPERVRHKNLSSPSHTQNNTPVNIPHSSRTSSLEETHPDRVIFRDATTTHSTTDDIVDEEEPIAPIRPPIHSKTKNWYSGFCNRWASLMGAATKILIMMLVNWVYALIAVVVVFIVWFYVGTANPAVKPGLAHEFRFFVWLKSLIFRCFGKRVHDYEQIVVTPSCPGINVSSTQLNDENEDFSSRRRYHQSSIVQGHYVDDI